MEKGESFKSKVDPGINNPTQHYLTATSGLTNYEFEGLKQSVTEHHTYIVGPDQCSSLLAQRIPAPPETMWSVVCRFDKPRAYKHFIKNCALKEGFRMTVGCTRDGNVIIRFTGDNQHGEDRYTVLRPTRHRFQYHRRGEPAEELQVGDAGTRIEGDGKIWTVALNLTS